MKPATVGAKRFDVLWRRCVASPPSPNSASVYADLASRLGAPNRHFHNLDHVVDCLRRSDEVASLLVDRDAVELALWFHDAVYELGAATNERRSAELFLAQSKGARPVFRRCVCGLILATRHAGTVRGNDRRFIVDIDLSGFGTSWREFMHNGARLRAEFSARTDAEFNAGQTVFLQQLQRRPRFYATDYFRDRYEAVARENLRRVLDLMAGQGYATLT